MPTSPFLLILATCTLALSLGSNAEVQTKPLQAQITTPATLETAKASAMKTMNACMKWVQMNVFEFEECVDAQMNLPKDAKAERLGVSYMGFVGALSAQRSGSQGSDQLAWKYAKQFTPIQKQLGFKDSELCVIVSGGCEVRTARAAQILKSPKPKPLTEAEISGVHKH